MKLIVGAAFFIIFTLVSDGKIVVVPGLPRAEEGCKWVPYTLGDKIPPYVVIGGHDSGNFPMYVGRCDYYGTKVPAKITPDLEVIGISQDGVELRTGSCELLTGGKGFSWVQSYTDYIPSNALLVDGSANDSPLYIGRAPRELTLTVGKVDPKQKKFLIGYNSKEIAYDQWETLVGPVTACSN